MTFKKTRIGCSYKSFYKWCRRFCSVIKLGKAKAYYFSLVIKNDYNWWFVTGLTNSQNNGKVQGTQ